MPWTLHDNPSDRPDTEAAQSRVSARIDSAIEQPTPTGSPAQSPSLLAVPEVGKVPLGKRATFVVTQERVVQVAQMLASQVHKCQIKRYLKEHCQIGPRQAECYISRARRYLVAQTQKPRELLVGEALGVYAGVLRSPESSVRDKIDATDRICRLLGLDKPIKVAPTTRDEDLLELTPQVIASMPTEQLGALHALHMRLLDAQRVTQIGMTVNT